ncbi:MAG TPA: beta-ketoacyl synthase chain length factor, partial [Candidatus Angelobacter sp.]|nr:beta-ketoacyl synthase chain length factor [Candidatus Angelobacter sp.]
LGLLEDMAKSEPLSPTAFSLSVHNATAGLFSIQQGLTSNITAISGGAQELVPALLESLGLCNAQTPQVLCVFCDEPTPDIYQHQADQPAHAYAVALIIGAGQDWQLEQLGHPVVESSAEPQSLQLLRVLQGEAVSLSLSHNGSSWQLGRCGA